jgi:alkylation response protein AidB-like acyl-CoA dehydrogenase
MSGSGSAFRLTEEQSAVLAEARRLGRDVLAPIAEGGEPGRVNRPLVRALAEHGLLGRMFPSRVGGARDEDVSAVDVCLLREGLAIELPEAETALAMQGIGGYPILQSGRPEVVERFVRPIAEGRAVAALALTEPGHGSDAGAIELHAERDGDGYRLTGSKTWISNAPDADVYTVFARTTADAGARGVTAFVVAGDSSGLSGHPLDLLSPHAIGTLEFDGVFVPAEQVLGEVDRGFRTAMRTLDLFRPSVGAFAVGMAQAALETAVEHAGRREAFGKPIREFQAVSHALADMATEVEAARLMVYAAAAGYDAGAPDVTKRSAMA